MKKLKIIIIGACIMLAICFIFKNTYNIYKLNIKDNTLNYDINLKGLYSSRDFAVDEENNYYIAYKDRVQFIGSNGYSFDIFTDKSLDISSLEYKSKKLYFSSGTRVYCYDIKKSEKKVIIDNLPNYGDFKESKIKIKNDELYISIGAATNSGVVGRDNVWVSINPFYHDISPKDIVVKGILFGSEKTGAFVPYKTKNASGQIISGHMPGNASIIRCNLNSGYIDTYAWGIRNINGMSFNSEGKLIVSVGGMEDRGLRPVIGDVDYIYEIKSGLWYGWPDYSGGDPLSSPRFKGENDKKISFIMENHPTTNPPAPIYQHNHLNSLKAVEIDTKGILGDKDCIYFYDARDNIIYELRKSGNSLEKIALNNDAKVQSLKMYQNNLIILDNNKGVIYSISKKKVNNHIKMDSSTFYYLVGLIICIIVLIIWKFNFTKKSSKS